MSKYNENIQIRLLVLPQLTYTIKLLMCSCVHNIPISNLSLKIVQIRGNRLIYVQLSISPTRLSNSLPSGKHKFVILCSLSRRKDNLAAVAPSPSGNFLGALKFLIANLNYYTKYVKSSFATNSKIVVILVFL